MFKVIQDFRGHYIILGKLYAKEYKPLSLQPSLKVNIALYSLFINIRFSEQISLSVQYYGLIVSKMCRNVQNSRNDMVRPKGQ